MPMHFKTFNRAAGGVVVKLIATQRVQGPRPGLVTEIVEIPNLLRPCCDTTKIFFRRGLSSQTPYPILLS